MIALLVRTDGRRDCIARSLRSLNEMVSGPITRRVIHDDSADDDFTDWLIHNYGTQGYSVISTNERRGFAEAIQNAWRYLEDVEERFVLDVEDDFTYSRPVDLRDFATLLKGQPQLAQIALRRQPVGNEPAEGGFIAAAPEWYTERELPGGAGDFVRRHHLRRSDIPVRHWIETRRNWTTNPSLYRAELVHLGWPDAPDSEGYFGFALKEDIGLPWGVAPEDVQFGIWGAIDDSPAIHHIGDERVGVGY